MLYVTGISHHAYLQRLRIDLEEREAHLRAKEEEMKQRDAEIGRLIGELRRCQDLLRQVSYHAFYYYNAPSGVGISAGDCWC